MTLFSHFMLSHAFFYDFTQILACSSFRVRDAIAGKWRQTRYRLSEADALDRYGAGNYERLDWSREGKTGSGTAHSTPLAPK